MDEALTRLDSDTRDLLVRHYLEGLPMTEIARQRGVSRPTISREVESGLAKLRAQLQRQGVLVAAGALSTLLSQSAAQSAPAAVLQQLGRIALMGVKAAPATALASVFGYSLAAAAKVKVLLVAAVVVAGAGLVTYMTLSPGSMPPRPGPATADREDRQARSRPAAGPEQPGSGETVSPAPDPQPPEKANSIASSPEPVAAQQAAEARPSIPWWSETGKQEGLRLDLSTPEAAVRSFTKAIVSGNAESVMACFLPGGTDFADMQEILNADPDDPKQQSEYEMRLWLQSLDPDAEMPIVASIEDGGATKVTWQVTFKKDVTAGGQAFRAGDTFNLDAALRQSGDSWLIDGL